jgi:hypothetical protein
VTATVLLVLLGCQRAGVAGSTHSKVDPYGVDAALMPFEQHERGIHVL